MEDRPLIAGGRIPLRHLFTIRQGEPALDNIAGRVLSAPSDRIKIKGSGRSWTCVYYGDAQQGCRIYEDRPLECRVLKCWDTAGIESIYQTGLLTRKDLIGGVAGLWELVADHHARCSYDDLQQLLSAAKNGDAASADALQEAVRYDRHLRRLTVERGLVAADMTDFLFGRPMADTLRPMGVRFFDCGGGLRLDLTAASDP